MWIFEKNACFLKCELEYKMRSANRGKLVFASMIAAGHPPPLTPSESGYRTLKLKLIISSVMCMCVFAFRIVHCTTMITPIAQ